MKIKFDSIINLFFVSIFLGQAIGYGKLYLFHVLLILTLISKAYFTSSNIALDLQRNKTYYYDFFKWMLFWYCLSILWSIEIGYSLIYLFYIILGVFIVYLTYRWCSTTRRLESIIAIFKGVFILQIIICLLEIFTPFRFPTSPYSEYASLFNKKASDLSVFNDAIQAVIGRVPTGFSGNPNNLAVGLVSALPFFLFNKKSFFNLLLILSTLTVLLYTGSRGSFIALVFCFFVFLYMKHKKYFFVLIGSIGVFFFSYSTMIEKLKNSENDRIAELAYTGEILMTYLTEESTSKNSISFRQELIHNGMEALWISNGLGVGGGGSQAVQEEKGGQAALLGSMHNFWIEILVEAGVLFFATFVIWYLAIMLEMYRIFRISRNLLFKRYSGATFLSLCVFSVACISASTVIYMLQMWFVFGVAISIYLLFRYRDRSIDGRFVIKE